MIIAGSIAFAFVVAIVGFALVHIMERAGLK